MIPIGLIAGDPYGGGFDPNRDHDTGVLIPIEVTIPPLTLRTDASKIDRREL